jgi:hypothetical protein
VYGVRVISLSFLIIHTLYKSSWMLSTLNGRSLISVWCEGHIPHYTYIIQEFLVVVNLKYPKKIPRASRKSKVLYIVFIVLIMYDYI